MKLISRRAKEATEAGNEADEPTNERGQWADEAKEANGATAGEADVAGKPAEAVEAEAYKANDAKADEADDEVGIIHQGWPAPALPIQYSLSELLDISIS